MIVSVCVCLHVCVLCMCMCVCVCARQLHWAPGTSLCRLGLLNLQLISEERKECTQMAVNVQKCRLHETCQLRFKFLLLFLWHCSIKPLSVYPPTPPPHPLTPSKNYKNMEALWHLKIYIYFFTSNEPSNYWTRVWNCHSSPQMTACDLTCFHGYSWWARLFCKPRE